MCECPQGKPLRESLEALAAGLAIQKQHHLPVVVLWSGKKAESEQLKYLAGLQVKRIIQLEGPEQGPEQEAALLLGLKTLYEQHLPEYFFFGASPLSRTHHQSGWTGRESLFSVTPSEGRQSSGRQEGGKGKWAKRRDSPAFC